MPDRHGDVAGVIAPPPVIYIVGLLVGFGLDALLPSMTLPGLVSWLLGGALLATGFALAAWFLTAFRRAHTPVDVRRPTSALVTSGPFAVSRNPGYLALTLIYLGVAILTSTVWALLSLIAAQLLVEHGVIRREERYLEAKFGEPYRRYQAHTRRWL